MKRIISVLGMLILAVSIVGCGQQTQEGKLKVGVILPLSGDVAGVGEACRNGMEMGIKDIDPDTLAKMEFFYEDDGLLPKNTISAFNKLVDINKIDVVFNPSSGTTNALAPLTEQKMVPLIAIASDKKVSDGRDYTVRLWVTPEEETKELIKEARKRGYDKIARISTIQEGMIAMNEAFDEANSNEIDIVLDKSYTADMRDFQTYIAELRETEGVDAIMTNLMPGQLGLFAKKLREGGVEIPIFGYEIFEDSNEVDSSDGALVGAWYVNSDDPDESFVKRYEEEYPGASFFGAPTGYDAVLLWAAAVENFGTDPDKVNQFLHEVQDFQGALGIYSATDNNDFTLPAAVKVITENGFEKLYKD